MRDSNRQRQAVVLPLGDRWLQLSCWAQTGTLARAGSPHLPDRRRQTRAAP